VLSRLRRPLLPAGPHVRGGATARHAPAVAGTAWPATFADGQPNHQSPDWYPAPAHGSPPSRKDVQRRTNVIALAPVLPVTRRAVLLVLPRFATLLSTTCGCAGGPQRVWSRPVLPVVSKMSQPQLRNRRPPLPLSPLPPLITYSPAKVGRSSAPAVAIVVAPPPQLLLLLRPIFSPWRCTEGASKVMDPGTTMRTFFLPPATPPKLRHY
jgi:hypothetical protein